MRSSRTFFHFVLWCVSLAVAAVFAHCAAPDPGFSSSDEQVVPAHQHHAGPRHAAVLRRGTKVRNESSSVSRRSPLLLAALFRERVARCASSMPTAVPDGQSQSTLVFKILRHVPRTGSDDPPRA